MSTLEKVLAGMFFLIGVYIVIKGSKGKFNTVITGLSGQLATTISSLQGR